MSVSSTTIPARRSGGTRWLAALLVVSALTLVGLALAPDRPHEGGGVRVDTATPAETRIYDGRGKWTGY